MATLKSYKCKRCGLEAEVSGGPDALFAGNTDTYFCKNCDALSDILEPFITFDERDHKECPDCQSTNLVKWAEGQPCPKCRGNLEVDPNRPITSAD